MTRQVLFTNLFALITATAGCQLIADFKAEGTEAGGADAGGNKGGATNKGGSAGTATSNGGTSSSSAGTVSSNGGAIGTNGGAVGMNGGATATSSGGTAGTGTTASTNGGTAGTGNVTTIAGGTSQGGVAGGTARGGSTSGGTSVGGAVTTGGKSNVAGATGGVTTTVGGAGTGGVATGGVTTTVGGATTGGSATGGAPGDTTPPTVKSVTPANGTNGVLASSTVTIDFSEAMNTTSTASAISISGLLASELSLAWNSSGTSVTVTPTGGLVYATGTIPNTAAKSYTITVGTGARDVAGNAMTTAFTSSFTTLKRITYVMSPSTSVESDTFGNVRTSCSDPLQIGGWSEINSSGDYIAYLVFDLSGVGSPSAMYSIESARISATQASETGNFYATPNHVEVWRLEYFGSLYNAQSFAVLSSLGTLASAATPVNVSIDALAAFKTDFVSNGILNFLFKMGPVGTGGWTSSGVSANFTCGGMYLTMIYLMP